LLGAEEGGWHVRGKGIFSLSLRERVGVRVKAERHGFPPTRE